MALATRTTFDPLLGGGGVGGGGGGASNNSYYMGVKSPANNSVYSGANSNSYSSASQAVSTIESATGTSIAKTATYNGQTFTSPIVIDLLAEASKKTASGGSGDNTDYKYYSDAERQALSNELKEMVHKAEQFQRFAQQQQDKATQLEEDLKSNEDGVNYSEGQSLPEVLSNNTKSLTTSINSLTSSVNDQFSLLNNNMMGMLIYFEQFLSNQVLGITSASQLPEAIRSIKPDKPDYTKLIEGVGEIKKSIDKLELNPSVSVEAPSVDVKVDNAPLAKSLDGINLTLDKLVKDETLKSLVNVQEKSKDNAKEFFDKKVEEADLNMESLEYDKKQQEVKDIDGEIVGTFAPREAVFIKNSVTAFNQTDEKNVEYDDLMDDGGFVLPELGGYPLTSDIIKDSFLNTGD